MSKRGSVEKTYAIAPKMPYEDTNRYFNGENPDPQRDLLTVRSASLMMSDEEMMEFITAYGQLIQKYLPNKPIGSRKVRKLTFVVSPNE